MVKIITYLFIISILFFSCEKRLSSVDEYLPDIEVSASVVSDGVSVSVNVLKFGASPIQKVGYSFSTDPDFSILENQVFLDWLSEENSTYTFPYYLFSEENSYFFKAFVTTKYGLVVSEEIEISNLLFNPVEAPCSVNLNTLRVFPNSFINIPSNNNPQHYTYYSEYSANTTGNNSVSVQLRIYKSVGSVPSTGVYQTSNSSSFGYGSVRLKYNSWTSQYGGQVYINRLNSSQFSVEACDIPVAMFDDTVKIESTMDLHWVIDN
jgi:hypothetical protein